MRRAEEERRRSAEQSELGGDVESPVSLMRDAVPRVAEPEGVSKNFLRELGMLRNAVEVALGGKTKRVLIFASAMPGEGTTTIATSFAKLAAMEGREHILLCEMNARRPSFSAVFSTNGDAGITEYFVSRTDLSSLIQRSGAEGLDVLHVGRLDATVIQLHLNAVFPRLLEEALRSYDTVIIDAPPIISAPEAAPMTAFADGVVLVVHAGKTKREVVARAMGSIANFKGRIIGVVLNRKNYYIPGFIYKRI
jgi:capsular exopolysaccharide synthesis family protein